jgi:Ca2+-binding RTX toxin-like protein
MPPDFTGPRRVTESIRSQRVSQSMSNSRTLLALLALMIAFVALDFDHAIAGQNVEAAPSCAKGPERRGDAVVGTPCADRIVVPASVEYVDGGPGDDTIIARLVTATGPCEGECLGVGSPVFEGGSGDDIVFGERGNDTIRGNGGNDRLFGGIGDDLLEGGPGEDLLAGGFGADSIDGQQDSDYVRGDGTIDHIYDTGASLGDTLSYADGVTPGFGSGIDTGAANFPPGENGERGVHLDLGATGLNGDNGIAAEGGGVDEVELGAFETIVGTAFPDYIVGGSGGETIYGGGGGDVIEGGNGSDQLFGGADGDFLDGGAGANSTDGGTGTDNCVEPSGGTGCEGTAHAVAPRDPGKVSVGLMGPAGAARSQLYVGGSSGSDTIGASYAAGTASFTVSGGASFDTTVPGCSATTTTASCAIGVLDSIVLAGLGGNDDLSASGFPQQTGVVLLGGPGTDTLAGGDASEDLLVDGRGAEGDTLSALGRDDALLHEGGADQLLGGEGNDLFLSTSICDGETVDGGEGRDNSSWARLKGGGVEAHLDAGLIGEFGAAGDPGCAGGGTPDSMLGIEDLEGSEAADTLVGDAGSNQLLGHKGPDEYFALAGADTILANSADSDPVINCGADQDQAVIDVPTATYADATPIECESVREGGPEDFRTATLLPPPPLPPAIQPSDTTPPRTRIARRPAKLLKTTRRRRTVVFSFTSDERGSTFRCRLDRKPFRPCASPRAYTVRPGRHTFRVFAIDRSGNRDPSPAFFAFRVRRR